MKEKNTKVDLEAAVVNLMYKNKIFAKCPVCSKYMCLFEWYNSHCNICGNVDSDKIILISLDP